LIGLPFGRAAFSDLVDDAAVVGNDHLPLLSAADDVGLVDRLAALLLFGDVFQFGADQLALDGRAHGRRRLLELDLHLAGLGFFGGSRGAALLVPLLDILVFVVILVLLVGLAFTCFSWLAAFSSFSPSSSSPSSFFEISEPSSATLIS
jgi:hypothetical protein